MRENLTSGSMWQGMENQELSPRHHPLTLPLDCGEAVAFAGIFPWTVRPGQAGFEFCLLPSIIHALPRRQ
jgi:hypothetical protein